jgi:acetyl-CoA C-acetyltransferase
MTNQNQGRDVYIVEACRTPFLKARGKPGPFAAADLAVYASRELFNRLPIESDEIGEAVAGCMIPSEDEANIGRIIALRIGAGDKVTGYTVQRNCASGMQALDEAFKDIKLNRHDIVLAGGVEAMSRAPLIYNRTAVNWFANMMKAKKLGQKISMFTKLPIKAFMTPIIALLRGLRDPVVSLGMGQTAENIADKFKISRKEMDKFAEDSHKKLAQAIDKGYLKDMVVPIFDEKGNVYEEDDGLRRDSTVENLAKLKPFFDRKFGKVTAANSSQITDGAAFMVLASEEAVKKYKLPVIAKIVDVEWAGNDPRVMGLAPTKAVPPLLKRHGLKFDDIEYWEINEAFATQVVGCLKGWADEKYCKEELGLDHAFGTMDQEKLNVDGGAVSIGHPVGASGARIVMHLINVMRRNKAKRGVATICIGGGQAGAMLIETVDKI